MRIAATKSPPRRTGAAFVWVGELVGLEEQSEVVVVLGRRARPSPDLSTGVSHNVIGLAAPYPANLPECDVHIGDYDANDLAMFEAVLHCRPNVHDRLP
jgi:hypothetical protein